MPPLGGGLRNLMGSSGRSRKKSMMGKSFDEEGRKTLTLDLVDLLSVRPVSGQGRRNSPRNRAGKHMRFKTLMSIYPSLTENKITTTKQERDKWLTNVLQQKYQCVSVWRKVWMKRVDTHTHTPTHSDANTEKRRKLVPYLFPTVISTPPQRHAGKAN